jgi:hypothetical protein
LIYFSFSYFFFILSLSNLVSLNMPNCCTKRNLKKSWKLVGHIPRMTVCFFGENFIINLKLIHVWVWYDFGFGVWFFRWIHFKEENSSVLMKISCLISNIIFGIYTCNNFPNFIKESASFWITILPIFWNVDKE